MRIADTQIPIAHTAEAVVSNFVYVTGAIGLCLVADLQATPEPAILAGLISIALVVQAYGSMLFHGTPDQARWAQLADAIGIQWVMSALIALGARAALGIEVRYLLPAVLVAWALWWTQADHVSRIASIVLQSLIVVGAVWVVAGWVPALALLVTILSAFAIQRLAPTHSWGHSLWHLLSAGAQLGAAWVLLL